MGLNGVASVLGKECWDVIVFEFLGSLIISRVGEGRSSTPRVDVVSPEIDGVGSITTVEVGSQVVTDGSIIVGSISNTNGSVVLGLDICLHVTNSGLDECTCIGVGLVVRNLVSGKEPHHVGVRSQGINDTGVGCEQIGVPFWGGSNDGVLWIGKILDEVDASGLEQLHARSVVEGSVDGVDTDNVDTKLL